MTRPPTPPPKQSGPVFLGHFRRGQDYYGWRPHGTEDWELILSLAGGGRVRFPAGEQALEPGCAILYRPHAPHDYFTDPAVGRWELIWAHFVPPPEWAELLHWPELSPGLFTLQLKHEARWKDVAKAMHRALAFSGRPWRRREAFAASALHEALLWCDLENPQSSETRLDPRVRRALDFMTADLRRPLRLGDVARASGISVSRLAELFRAQMGLAPRQYWERHRLERARQLLSRTQSTVAEVAEAVGFEDPFYFSTRFRRAVGKSPRAYRNEQTAG